MNLNRIFALLAILCCSVSANADEVKMIQKDGQVVINIGSEHFTTFNYKSEQVKPYFHPVYAPGKVLVVREKVFGKEGEQGNDAKTGMGHFHHKGIWTAIDSINDGINYWHERERIETQSVKVSQKGKNGILVVENNWNDREQKPLLKETTTYTITPNRVIEAEIKLTAVQEVTFGDTKEGLFAIRLHHDLRGLSGGSIINSRGEEGEKECWGKPAPWIDYYGSVNGKSVGVTIFDDPQNFRPSRYHVRGYGLFAINPFGEKKYSNGKNEEAPVTLKPDESVALRYGIYIHSGSTTEADVASAYENFVGKN